MPGLFTGTMNFAILFGLLIVLLLPIVALAYLAPIYKSVQRIEALLAERSAIVEQPSNRQNET